MDILFEILKGFGAGGAIAAITITFAVFFLRYTQKSNQKSVSDQRERADRAEAEKNKLEQERKQERIEDRLLFKELSAVLQSLEKQGLMGEANIKVARIEQTDELKNHINTKFEAIKRDIDLVRDDLRKEFRSTVHEVIASLNNRVK